MASKKRVGTKKQGAKKSGAVKSGSARSRTVRSGAARSGAGLVGVELREANATTVLTDARIKLLNIRGSENVSDEFKDKVVQIAERLETNPNFLMAVMSFESGGTFSPSVVNAAGSGAVGLIQFIAPTAKGLGTTIEELKRMTAVEQLDFVEKHFRPFKGRLNTIEDTYMAVLLPKAVGKGSDFVLFQKPSKAYDQNRGLDIDRDGRITVFDATDKVRRLLSEAGAGVGEVLRRGSEGTEVDKLQDELIELGHLREEQKATAPGKFGPMTEAALKEFQSDNHLQANGTYDTPTQEAVRQLNEGVARGSRGGVVRGLQDRLVKLRALTVQDVAAGAGTFGPKTEGALKLFQQHHGIAANGVLTAETYKALRNAAPVVQPGAVSGGTSVDTLLPAEGRGYKTYNRQPGGADQFGRAATIRNIQALAETWADRRQDGIPIYVGDISLRGGGPFRPHSSHKDGRDVDLRPFKHNGVEGPTQVGAVDYDHALTRELVLLIRELFPNVRILFNDPVLIRDRLTQHFAGHHNHLHVRFLD
jgi:peptidoglycan hydrolase-like protein with peptidoglycan-binding domain